MGETAEHLPWDSQFFGKRVGRLSIQTNNDLDRALRSSDQENFELVYIYSPIAIERISIGQFSLCDVGGHITFAKDLANFNLGKPSHIPEIKEYQGDVLSPELLELAFLSGNFSRFRVDPSLPVGSFERLYKCWIAETLKNRPKTAIFTYQLSGKAAGFATVSWHDLKCTIDLLGVLRPHQGHGVASKLIQHITKTCIDNKINTLEVKTQLSNAIARSLYLKNSFSERDRSCLYHAHNHRLPRRQGSHLNRAL